MTRQDFHRLRINATECNRFDEYVFEASGSLPGEYYTEDGIADKAVSVLEIIWGLRDNYNFSAVRKASGLTQRSFSEAYGIPLRSVENWDASVSTPPPYLLDLLAADVISNLFYAK
jgi:hypothetical protein